MSSSVKSSEFVQAVLDCVHNNSTFKCGRNYADLLIWTRLCAPLTNSEIFAFLPVAVRTVWADKEISMVLFDRGAQKPERFDMQTLAANLVSFRRTDAQNDETNLLKEQLATLTGQFNQLSYAVFDVVERLNSMEQENFTLRQKLAQKGLISQPAQNEISPILETKNGFIPIRFDEAQPMTCQILRSAEDASNPLTVL